MAHGEDGRAMVGQGVYFAQNVLVHADMMVCMILTIFLWRPPSWQKRPRLAGMSMLLVLLNAASHVKKVCWLASVQLFDDVHGKPGSVDQVANVSLNLDIVESVLGHGHRLQQLEPLTNPSVPRHSLLQGKHFYLKSWKCTCFSHWI